MEAEESEGLVSDRRQPLTRGDLDTAGVCAIPSCTAVHGAMSLSGRCHPGRPQEVTYECGVLTVRCSKCQELTAEIAVAHGGN